MGPPADLDAILQERLVPLNSKGTRQQVQPRHHATQGQRARASANNQAVTIDAHLTRWSALARLAPAPRQPLLEPPVPLLQWLPQPGRARWLPQLCQQYWALLGRRP